MMMQRFLSIFFALCCAVSMQAQQGYKKAYTLFDDYGREIGYDKMIQQLAEADVVFIGEIHNCSITHWLEQEIVQSLHAFHGSRLMLGEEMLEADNSLLLQEYLQGVISEERFEEEARLWPNYSTDYAPVLQYAKEHHIPFIATNVPRRYANVARRKGLEALERLSPEAKKFLPPLPIPFESDSATQATFSMMRAMGGHTDTDGTRLEQAQAVKDATMAWQIARHIKDRFIHINGNFHTDFKKGIIRYLQIYKPGLKIKTVCSVRQECIDTLGSEQQGRADFYICVPENMTKTY